MGMTPSKRICALFTVLAAASAHADWLIRGASVIDGSGGAAYTADVALRGGRIAGIGTLETRAGDRVVEAAGLVLAPGFIDAHSHHNRALDENLDATSAVSQGITTVIVGADGGSELPLADWMTTRERAPAAFNLASFTGHGTLRREVLGANYKRAVTADEQARMEKLLDADMDAGSLGLSSGLEYDPGIYSSTPELVGLARVAAARGGIYVSHVRSEDVNLDDAWAEVATIAREAKIRAQISHMKISLIDRWGQAPDFLRRLESWRAEGIDIAGDVYPYTYWNSTFTSIFPKRDFSSLEDARHALEHVAHADGLIIAKYLPEPRFVGMTVADIAKERAEPAEKTLLWLINRAYPDGNYGVVDKPDAVMGVSMREDDVATFINWPLASICSDGGLTGGHPRGAGAFPRFLRHYVLDKDPAGLPAAIRRTSALTAERYGLADRGLLTQGRAADLVLFDPATIRDNASIKDSRAVATGIRGVWVNGEQVWDGAKPGGALPGKVLRRSGK